jgi:hypothetical protein
MALVSTLKGLYSRWRKTKQSLSGSEKGACLYSRDGVEGYRGKPSRPFRPEGDDVDG